MRKFAALLGIAGVGVWTLGIVAWISGVWVTMAPGQVRVLVLTGAALSGAALLVTAAIIGRSATTLENRRLAERGVLPEIPAASRAGDDFAQASRGFQKSAETVD